MARKLKKEFTREDFVKWGKQAGKINKAKGTKYFSKLGKLGAAKRWGN
jgi:hypothetical protein